MNLADSFNDRAGKEPGRAIPPAAGPYSHSVAAGGFVFTSGQIPVDAATGELVPGGIEEQAVKAFGNLGAVLEAAGSSIGKVIRVTIYLTDLSNFSIINGIYREFFREPYPARACVEVSRLPKDAQIEVDAIATL